MIARLLPYWLAAMLVAGTLALVARRRGMVGTTLIAPWHWAVLAMIAVGVVEAAIAWQRFEELPPWVSHVRYLAAVTTFCPLMALLGAKRPQDRAWQFVVLSLYVVLALPAAEAWLYRPDAVLELHAARRWFLLVLIGVGLVNTLPTRYWTSSLLASLGQGLLLGEHLPGLASLGAGAGPTWGFSLIVLAAVLWAVGLPRGRSGEQPWDRVWFDFRDSYGTFWSLRIAERFNAAAHRYGWNVRLRWHGFVRVDEVGGTAGVDAGPPEITPAMRENLLGLLWRFVSLPGISGPAP